MQTLGLIGGMSWESTAQYYRLLNAGVRDRLGGLHSARCLISSLDMAAVATLQKNGQWDEAGALLAHEARALQQAGAGLILLCTNTMHKVAPAIEAAITVPFLHIADPVARAIRTAGLQRVGLLGTAFTMEQDFYTARLRERHGLEVLVPAAADRARVHNIIFDELCQGVCQPASRATYREIIAGLAAQGAEGIILGCTEIMLLIGSGDSPVPLFDTTALHAAAGVEFLLSGEGSC